MNILLVDDESNSRESVAEFLFELGHQVKQANNAGTAYKYFLADNYPLVITDIRMPGMDGIEFLQRLKEVKQKNVDVIVYTGHGDIDTAIAALRYGAYDYLQKPINVSELALLVEKCAEHQHLLSENNKLNKQFDETLSQATSSIKTELEDYKSAYLKTEGIFNIIGVSEQIKQVIQTALLFHQDKGVPVIIEGETGTGKELVAKLIHYGNSLTKEPFIDINCAAISPELFESELFGYEAGSFTGGKATGEKGKIALAEKGCLFLDEIGEMPLNLQPKLLRVLQDNTYYRVGGLKKENLEARVVCATNRSLEEMVEQNAFRRDLFYRLNVGYIKIPPLRERQEDIPELANSFLQRESKKRRRDFTSISNEAMDFLSNHPWPGNIRQLENTIERAVLSANAEILELKHLSFLNGNLNQGTSDNEFQIMTLNEDNFVLPEETLNIEALNSQIVVKALEKFDGNKSKTAKYLGISRNSLYCKINKNNKEG